MFKDKKIKVVENIEVTSYRSDIYNECGKLNINYVSTLKDDCLRRDFTINAIAEDIHGL